MGRLSKCWSLTSREKQFFCEAFRLLLLSQVSVKVIAFRHIYSFLLAYWNDHPPSTLDRADDITLVNLSLSRAANALPWKSLCLSRSIAAFIMFRRRGIPAVMFVGAKFEDSALLAHAWVQAGPTVPDGKAEAEKTAFTKLISIG